MCTVLSKLVNLVLSECTYMTFFLGRGAGECELDLVQG